MIHRIEYYYCQLCLIIKKKGVVYSFFSIFETLLFDLINQVETVPSYADRFLYKKNKHAKVYGPCDTVFVNKAFDFIRGINIHNHLFIDYGCGKGKALILALKDGYKSVIGIELFPELSVVCRKNLENFSKANQIKAACRVVSCDALEYIPSLTPTVFSINDSFDASILDEVLENIDKKLGDTEHYLLYSNPVDQAVVLKHGFKMEKEYFFPGTNNIAIMIFSKHVSPL
jgi:SAM-dependent methyltransferase